jgi:hypothetical protein
MITLGAWRLEPTLRAAQPLGRRFAPFVQLPATGS